MDDIKFSVIVPVYGVEKYIEKCINSVLEQTYMNYELILVDDGSPDNCGKICDRYAENDSRINVIHKRNGGLPSARNAGLDVAHGEYVIFLDSDDFWDDREALLSICINLSESKADVLIFPAKRYYGANGKCTYIIDDNIERSKIISSDKFEVLDYLIENNIYRAAAWNKVVRRTLIKEHKMRFAEGYLSEDMDWCGDLLVYAQRFDYYKSAFYCYRQQRAGSITKVKNEKLISDKLYMCEKGLKQAQTLKDEMTCYLASYYAYEYSVAVGVSAYIKSKELKERLRDLSIILEYDISNKVKKVNRAKKLLGYSLTRSLLCIFVKVKR